MIECCNENIWYIKRKRKKSHRKFRIIFLILLIIIFYVYYTNLITKNISTICYEKIKSIATESLNRTILEKSQADFSYNNLINVETNSEGDITLLETNTKKVNIISTEIAIDTKERLEKTLNGGIEIPIYAFTGIKIFSGYGKKINFKSFEIVDSIGEIQSEFEESGINQTKHNVFLISTIKIKVILPLRDSEIEIKTPVLLCETILVGKIPEVYLNK